MTATIRTGSAANAIHGSEEEGEEEGMVVRVVLRGGVGKLVGVVEEGVVEVVEVEVEKMVENSVVLWKYSQLRVEFIVTAW